MLLKISKFFIYLAVFAPIIVLPSTLFPFIGGKDYFFRICIELSLAFLILYWAFEAQKGEILDRFKKIVKNPLFIAVSIFALMFLLASIFAYDPKAAFWSNYERGEGGFQMIHYYLFFVLLAFHLQSWKSWKTGMQLFLTAAVMVIGYGILANILGPNSGFIGDPNGWHARFQASLGNPDYVGIYLVFPIFFALFLLFSKHEKITVQKIIIYGSLIIFYLIFFIAAETRSTFFGLGAAIAVFLLALALTVKKIRTPIITTLIILIILTGTLIYYHNSSFVKNLPGGRFFDISGFSSISHRFWAWKIAFQAFLERPIFGWGPENFSAAFDKYFNPAYFNPQIPGGGETWFDRAHSVIFDYLAETGILGLLSYLGIFLAFYWEFFKTWLKNNKENIQIKKPSKQITDKKSNLKETIYWLLIFVLPIAYFVNQLALFDVLPIILSWFFFLAFAVYQFNAKYQNEQQR